jgi:hypothetical protein
VLLQDAFLARITILMLLSARWPAILVHLIQALLETEVSQITNQPIFDKQQQKATGSASPARVSPPESRALPEITSWGAPPHVKYAHQPPEQFDVGCFDVGWFTASCQ